MGTLNGQMMLLIRRLMNGTGNSIMKKEEILKTEILPINRILGENFEISYKYRKSAALIAIIIPLIFCMLLLMIIVRDGLDSLYELSMSRSISGYPFMIGYITCLCWFYLYTLPALNIILKKGRAIAISGNKLLYFGEWYQLNDIQGFYRKNYFFKKEIALVKQNSIFEKQSSIFINLPS